jgi:hypothetical protein
MLHCPTRVGSGAAAVECTLAVKIESASPIAAADESKDLPRGIFSERRLVKLF